MTEPTTADGCLFCRIADGSIDSWRVYESDSAYAFFDIHPVNEFHTLVVPKRHFANLFDIPESELLEVMSAVKAVVDLYRDNLGLTDLQLLCTSGVHAQQTASHLHVHIVPRHENDGQDIDWATHDELVDRFEALSARIPGAGLRKARSGPLERG